MGDAPLLVETAVKRIWLVKWASVVCVLLLLLLLTAPTECIRCSDVFVVTVVIIVELDGVPFRHEWCMGMRWLPASRTTAMIVGNRERDGKGQRVI